MGNHILRVLVALLITAWGCPAQIGLNLESMQNPPGLAWKQIDAPHFKIVFPAEISRDAQQVANLLEHLYEADSRSLQSRPRKISLVLHNQNTEANGFVSLAPRQSEWFNTPPQVGLIGCVPWRHLLAVHEFRHVVQFDRALCGMTKWLRFSFGDFGHAVGAMMNLPAWLLEGDAVVMETALTRGGRGRMPEFTMPNRTMLLSGKRHSYYKMIYGSYSDWSADPYSFGYLMVARLRREKGAAIWSNVISSTMALSLLPYRFPWSLRRQTGLTATGLYNATMEEVKTLWQEQLATVDVTPAEQINHSDRFLTHYLFPKSMADRSILVLKFGLADRFSLTRLSQDGKEKILHLPASPFLYPPSVEANKIVWTEQRPHPRWGYADYSSIQVYDLNSGRSRRLTDRSKYMAPALSTDGRRIAAVEFTPENRCRLVILDAETGVEIKRYPNPENAFLMTPTWSPDGHTIALNALTEAGRSLVLLNLETGQWDELIPSGDQNTGLPVFYQDYVLFNWDYSGIDNIYAIHRQNKKIWQVTSRKFGAFNPSVSRDGRLLYFNDYDAKGYQVAVMELDSPRWREWSEIVPHPFGYHEPLVQQEAGKDFIETRHDTTFKIEDYRPLKDAIRPHSWVLPIATDSYETITAQLVSQNLLGTIGWMLGYAHNQNEGTHAGTALLSYAGWYPIVDLGARFGGRTSSYQDAEDRRQLYSWKEQGLSLGLRLPLNLTRSVYQTHLSLGASAEYTKISDKDLVESYEQNNGAFTPVTYYAQFSRTCQWINEAYPRFGQSISVLYRHVPLHSDYHARLTAARVNLYFPGFYRLHGWRWQLAAEKQKADNYRFENQARLCRGYGDRYHDFFYRWSADYALPLAFPDWNGLGLIYVKKLTAALFYDDVRARTDDKKTRYRAAGIELTAYMHLLSIPVELPLGVRFAYLPAEKKWQPEFIMALEL